jgi:2',3'-cyclic-nucleotide 2'-phosphodiesterase (5'-nucleotidase family)
MAAAAGADLAFHNSATIRAGLPRGPVTTRLMYDVLSFANQLLTYRLTGREIEALFQTYLAGGPGLVQFHGLQVRAYPRPGGGLAPAEIRADRGEALEPERVYSVAVNGFLSRWPGAAVKELRWPYRFVLLIKQPLLLHPKWI